MIPDKIYLVKPLCASEQDAPFISDVELPHYLNTCYVRKDALFEMLKGYSHPLTQVVVQELIDKINSL